jgi:hypothetical protein
MKSQRDAALVSNADMAKGLATQRDHFYELYGNMDRIRTENVDLQQQITTVEEDNERLLHAYEQLRDTAQNLRLQLEQVEVPTEERGTQTSPETSTFVQRAENVNGFGSVHIRGMGNGVQKKRAPLIRTPLRRLSTSGLITGPSQRDKGKRRMSLTDALIEEPVGKVLWDGSVILPGGKRKPGPARAIVPAKRNLGEDRARRSEPALQRVRGPYARTRRRKSVEKEVKIESRKRYKD